MRDIIHHYTNINTLALILKHRTLRFNRLDRVDDLSEANAFERLNLGEFFFVSSWTYDQSESIPQWNMYTKDMAGLRISLPKGMFKYEPLKIPEGISGQKNGEIYSPITFDKMFGDRYMILPSYLTKGQFVREVKYEEDYKEQKNKAISVTKKDNGRFKAQIKDPARIASLKSPDWAFQKEIRFVLFIFPSLPLEPLSKEFSDKVPNFITNKLYHGEGPNIEYIDLKYSREVLEEIKITLGPLCNEGDYVTVESLLAKYAPNGELQESKFTGTIRRP